MSANWVYQYSWYEDVNTYRDLVDDGRWDGYADEDEDTDVTKPTGR